MMRIWSCGMVTLVTNKVKTLLGHLMCVLKKHKKTEPSISSMIQPGKIGVIMDGNMEAVTTARTIIKRQKLDLHLMV